MDGNRRWAKAEGRPVFDGHKVGYEKLKETVRWAKKKGIACVVAFAFSTENWSRTEKEVSYLLELFRWALEEEFENLKKEEVALRFVGDRSRFSKKLQALMTRAEEETKHFTGTTLALAMSYGGRAEILSAVNALVVKGKKVDEKTFSKALWTNGLPDPDLIIRTSGEMRLSGFLPWQGVYAELFFTKTLWPAFSKEEFEKILEDFAARERRNGK